MLLDMTQILSGAVDRLEFSYTLSADCIPYEGAPETEDETDEIEETEQDLRSQERYNLFLEILHLADED